MPQDQEEELLALESIYGEECCINRSQRSVNLVIALTPDCTVALLAHLPIQYPKQELPLVQLIGESVTKSITERALEALQEQFVPGEPFVTCARSSLPFYDECNL